MNTSEGKSRWRHFIIRFPARPPSWKIQQPEIIKFKQPKYTVTRLISMFAKYSFTHLGLIRYSLMGVGVRQEYCRAHHLYSLLFGILHHLSTWLAIREGNSPVVDGLSHKRPVMRVYAGFFDVSLNKLFNKQSSDLRRHDAHVTSL